ncbi:MAG: hypothetical protein DRP22_01270 [Verrucomicrobia bacterium]|nr:MAG: hypothetical protein DRP22_01270 [Verrucomicrobiota bacterium]
MPHAPLPPLVTWDWLVIVTYFLVTLGIGLFFSRRAEKSMADFFVAGRRMTWWLAGTSIVATSFAADTPLVISGWLRTAGLERNWFWWGGIMGMMLCTFFFARLWRRAGILTDVEFIELRYSGRAAAGLRLFQAGFRSLVQNTLVMGWVTLAMAKILDVTLNIPTLVWTHGELLPVLVPKGTPVAAAVDPSQIAHWPVIGAAVIPAKVTGIVVCLGVAAFYSAASGLWGVVATDFFQFGLAMAGSIALMIISLQVAGGPTGLVNRAAAAVKQGRVVNTAAADRSHTPWHPAYGQAGLLRRDPGGGAVWSADGMSEEEVLQRLRESGEESPERLIGLWREAYTISLARITDFSAVQPLIEAGILVRDQSRNGKPTDYLRIHSLSYSATDIDRILQKAGVENRGEILAAWRGDRVVPVSKITSFLPPFDLKGGGLLAVWSLIVFLGLQWWAGGEGGGFLAQRLFSCKNEKHSVLAMLWFNFLNYVVRPWPWIVVGIASLFLIPDITAYGAKWDQEYSYVVMLMKYMPIGLKGLMVASLMAAYMSTISTQVNFGASYFVNDIYKRFIRPGGTARSDIWVSRMVSILLAVLAGVYAALARNIASGWFTFFELMSGAGFVVLLRWYWWRINVWSEFAAMGSSLLMFALLNWTHMFHALFQFLGLPGYLLDAYAVRFTLNVLCSSAVWLAVTFLTRAEPEDHLVRFYRRVRPPGAWKKIAAKAGFPHHLVVGRIEWTCWLLGTTALFAMIFAVGKCCFGRYLTGLLYALYGVGAAGLIFRLMRKMDWTDVVSEESNSPQEVQP